MLPSAPTTAEPQSAAAVLMVRPARFGFNPETAASNAFQSAPSPGQVPGRIGTDAQASALREFDGLADQLQRAGIEVVVGEDTPEPPKPDAIFPNNWVSFHHDGTVVLYPMLAPNRRQERREDLLRRVTREGGFRVVRTVDLTHRETEGEFLEGTGSMVLDRTNRIAYACLSPRTDLDVLGEFAQLLDYELVTFEALDVDASPIYHTNVLMAVGTRFAVLCADVVRDHGSRTAVTEKLCATGHRVIEISIGQMERFAGNLLELAAPSGKVIALSTNAWGSLEPPQRRVLEGEGTVVAADIPVIERLGGGGVRCMLAEIHLPRR
jgi:hypothetical protein